MIDKIYISEKYGCDFLNISYHNVSASRSIAIQDLKDDLTFLRDVIDEFLTTDLSVPFERKKNLTD